MQNQGWLKIHRKMLGWEWYDDIKTKVLFIHLLLVCNFKQTKWRGVELEEGETIKSIETLSQETTLSVRSIRTSINKLKTTGELTERWHGKYRILKLKNYKQYQINDTEDDSSATRQRQDSDIKTTADKERKEIKKEKNEEEVVAVAIRFYEKNIAMLTPYILDELVLLEKEHGEDNLVKALKVTCDANQRNIRYVKGILDNEKASGYTWQKMKKIEEKENPHFKGLSVGQKESLKMMIKKFQNNLGYYPEEINIQIMREKIINGKSR